MKTRIKIYPTIALFVSFSLFATVLFANGEKKNPPVAQLKYIGNIGNQPVFQLDLNNDSEDNFIISIRNQFGESIYSEKVKAKTFTMKFRLDTETLEDNTLKVEIRSKNGKKPEVFTINRYSRFVEEASVSEQ